MLTKKIFYWGLGFIALFLFNLFVEAIVLTYLDLHNTDKNDIYFQSWWLVVGLWALFGLPIISKIQQPKFQNK